jgi:hypothetical protein
MVLQMLLRARYVRVVRSLKAVRSVNAVRYVKAMMAPTEVMVLAPEMAAEAAMEVK